MNQNNLPQQIPPELLKRILSDSKVMVGLVRRSFFHFFYIFFGPYIQYPIAPFHRDMFRYAEDESIKRILLIAFRGSAKSTIYNTALALWAITGKLKKKHVAIASHTQQRAYDHSANIAREVEQNDLLRKYLGPFEQEQGRWSVPVRVIPRYDARISFISVEEGIRGLREGPNRPDLIIVDDIEDYGSVKTKEGRDTIFQWLTGELIPAGDINTKVVCIGNFLHEDSALMRILKLMQEGKMDGKYMKIPLIDDNGNITWPGKFPSMEAVEEFKRGIGNELTWQREFLLRAIPDDYQIIKPESIRHYDELPQENYRYLRIGVDVAITQNDSSDYTAMVAAKVYGYEKEMRIYILPNPVNERLDFPQIVEKCKLLQSSFEEGDYPEFLIEEVGFQKALTDQLTNEGIPARGVKIGGQDKEGRLWLTANSIKSGRILFPREGAERLIEQLVGFRVERHDDLVDAFTLLILDVTSDKSVPVTFHWL